MASFKTSGILVSVALLIMFKVTGCYPQATTTTKTITATTDSQQDYEDYYDDLVETSTEVEDEPIAERIDTLPRKVMCSFDKKSRASYTCKRIRSVRSVRELNLTVFTNVELENRLFDDTTDTKNIEYKLNEAIRVIEEHIANETNMKLTPDITKRSLWGKGYDILPENHYRIYICRFVKNLDKYSCDNVFKRESNKVGNGDQNALNLAGYFYLDNSASSLWENRTKFCIDVQISLNDCRFRIHSEKYDFCDDAEGKFNDTLIRKVCIDSCKILDVCVYPLQQFPRMETLAFVFTSILMISVTSMLLISIISRKVSKLIFEKQEELIAETSV